MVSSGLQGDDVTRICLKSMLSSVWAVCLKRVGVPQVHLENGQ